MKRNDKADPQIATYQVYYPKLTPMSAMRRYVQQIAERFRPEKIILFGSYALGTATPDTDVDLLVIMPTRNQLEQAVRIDETLVERGFPLDLLVRTPKVLADRIRWGDTFLQEIVVRGKVLYEKVHAPMGAQGRKRRRRRSATLQAKASAHR